MNAELLLKYYDRISEAPDAIARLRHFILDLAVRGKLVEQNHNDEPAWELLKRIQTEKERLVKSKSKKPTAVNILFKSIEFQFELPASWKWVCLGDIAQYGVSEKVDSNKEIPNDFWILDLEDIEKDTSRLITRALSETRPFKSSKTLFKRGDVLFGKLRPYLNKVLVADSDGVCTSEIVPIRAYCGISPEYIKLVLKSPLTMARVDRLMYGMKMPRLGTNDAILLNIPLAPLSEQDRIVTKVEELMALCDRLEAARTKQEETRNRFSASTFVRLNSPDPDPATFVDHARFALNNISTLTAHPDQVKQLRQTILTLAVRGKLVPQNSNDEPVSAILERKGERPLDASPFVTPLSWRWLTVKQIGDTRLGKMLDKAKNKGTPHRYLRNVNVRWFDFDLSDVYEMPFEDDELEEFSLNLGDVLICEGGEPGRAAVWDKRENDIYFQKAIHRLRFAEGVNPHYFAIVLRESADSGRLATYFTGVGIKHFTGKGLASFAFPVPPLAEQHRIVAKVNELMSLCDQLEEKLHSATAINEHLLEAVLHEALIPAA